ncbi:MAG: hypothetical protein GC184_15145 [Rhizobiales bacterium]|nr:hypothetical protein [Hyphomicrobiales bacterium]
MNISKITPEGCRHIARQMLVLTLLASPLMGCALANVAGDAPPALYVLTVPDTHVADTQLAAAKPAILVGRFAAPAAIDTARIVYQPAPTEVKYYAAARWSDTAPSMIHDLMVEALDHSAQALVMGNRSLALSSDYELVGDIRQFGARPKADGSTEVDVVLAARLVRSSDRAIISSRSFQSVVASEGRGMEPVIAAFNQALQTNLADMTGWVLATASTDKR